ncbi:transcriptional regulator GcvA [Variovorax ginsengisoli]|uniref:Transcriptional regulator GcvA n=2 Tax=Variovorax ginsengisoli TaxID=363844 RepID=A0ABT8SCI4_9BURK|nr:transcriptional regulator GcvA [Variovorax ginsengisoli]MDO1536543.1 transcriptional regulator GcvA [Variovorax ginsengisoli]
MTRKLPPLNAVRAFEAAARHVSFTRAAEELHVTHGAVSRQVALLEAWLGSALFRRSASRMVLTDAGRSYAAEVTSMLDRLAVASMQFAQQDAPVSLGVNAPPTFTMRWLIARMSSFQRQHPEIEVRLTTSLSTVNFHENGYDIAIRGAHDPLPGCRSDPFMTELVVPVCHTDLLERGRLRDPGDLRHHTLIRYATEPYSWPDWLEAAGERDLQAANTLHFEQMYFALQAAAEGLGIVLVPLFLVVDDIVAGNLCAPFGLLAALQRQYYANVPLSGKRSPAVRAFCDWLAREGRDTEDSIANWANSMGWSISAIAPPDLAVPQPPDTWTVPTV